MSSSREKPSCRALLVMVGVALFLGCTRPAPSIRPLGPDAVVLCFGDSLTSGSGAERTQAYPAVLATLIGGEVINEGAPGEVSTQGLRRLPSTLDRHQPDLVILCHGGNDLLQKEDPDVIARNIRDMITVMRERDIDVVLVGVPAPGLVLRTAPFYERMAREAGVPYEGEIVRHVLSRASLRSDDIHPNADGYKRMAKAIADLVALSATDR